MPGWMTSSGVPLSGFLLSPVVASRFIAGSQDVTMLAGALELLSDALDAGAVAHTADSFHGTNLQFQTLAARGDLSAALSIAHNELASLVAGISDDSWSKINGSLRHSLLCWQSEGDVQAGNSEAKLADYPCCLFPRIIADDPDPKTRTLIRKIMREAFGDLIYTSLSDSVEHVIKSGILDLSGVKVRITNETPEGAVNGAKWLIPSEVSGDIPVIVIAIAKDADLETPTIADRILTARRNGGKWAFTSEYSYREILRAEELGNKTRLGRKINRRPFESIAAGVQLQLLRQDHVPEMILAFRKMGLDNSSIDELVKDLQQSRLWFSLPNKSKTKKLACQITTYNERLRPLKVSRPAPKRELIVSLSGGDRAIEKYSKDDFYAVLARAYLTFVTYGSTEERLLVSLSSRDDKDLLAPMQSLAFAPNGSSANMTDSVPTKWSREYFNILRSAYYLIGEEKTADESLESLHKIISPDLASSPFKRLPIASSVRVIHTPANDEGVGFLKSQGERLYNPTLEIRINVRNLAKKYSPFEFAEATLAAFHGGTSGLDNRRTLADFLLKAKLSPQFSDAMAWLKLFWNYKKLSPSTSDDLSLELTGDASEKYADDLSKAILKLQILENDRLNESLQLYPNWFVEAADRTNPIFTNRMDKVTVVVIQGARLIHMNGVAELSDDQWLRLVRAVAFAPEGLTWIDLSGGWSSNRRELIASEESEQWYDLNSAYLSADNTRRSDYRRAIQFVRRIQTKYADIINLPLITPLSSRNEVRQLKGKILGMFHPDMSKTDTFIDIGPRGQEELIQSLRVIGEFHQPPAGQK